MFSSWEDILFGVPEESKLGWILFTTFLSDLLLFIYGVVFASYADENTIYFGGDSIGDFILSQEDSTKKIFQWFLQ